MHETVDAWVIRKGDALTVLVTNHQLPHHPIKTERVRLKLTDAPKPSSIYVERIDSAHANAKATWVRMGAPQYLSVAQVEHLQEASRMRQEPHQWEYEEQELNLEITLPPHSVTAITIELMPDSGRGVRA